MGGLQDKVALLASFEGAADDDVITSRQFRLMRYHFLRLETALGDDFLVNNDATTRS